MMVGMSQTFRPVEGCLRKVTNGVRVTCGRPFISISIAHQRNWTICSSAAAGSLGGESMGEAMTPSEAQVPEQRTYTPFPRKNEGNPYRLLGISKEAGFDEVVSVRNFLLEEYKWHEPSREAIELAYEKVMQEKFQNRRKQGFNGGPTPLSYKRGSMGPSSSSEPTFFSRINNLFDPTITVRTLINEGLVFFGLALWTLGSTDQSFSLAAAFAYSVYKFQSKRVRTNPDGPHFGGNPMIGALLSTVASLALGCALMTAITSPLSSVIEGSTRQIGGCIVVLVVGLMNVYLK